MKMVIVACALLLVGAFLCPHAQEWVVGWVSCAEGRGSSACGLIHACLPAPLSPWLFVQQGSVLPAGTGCRCCGTWLAFSSVCLTLTPWARSTCLDPVVSVALLVPGASLSR